MKNFIYVFASILIASSSLKAQETKTAPPNEFDKKFRFGMRITPQPTWFVSGDKNNVPAGAILGFGFGLNIEYKFSDIASIMTGIGADFEGGKYKVKYDPGNYEVRYWLDENGDFVTPSNARQRTNTGYILKERKIKTTFASVPVILKMSTNEYNGMKYFGMFGAEIGYRIKTVANDTYYSYHNFPNDTTIKTVVGEFTENDININEDAALFPIRFGMNVGLGTEYRLAGNTSLYGSINYFRNFTNLMAKESDFMVYKWDNTGTKYVKQNLKLTGIRINIGIMF
jgi:hypothetical protein